MCFKKLPSTEVPSLHLNIPELCNPFSCVLSTPGYSGTKLDKLLLQVLYGAIAAVRSRINSMIGITDISSALCLKQ